MAEIMQQLLMWQWGVAGRVGAGRIHWRLFSPINLRVSPHRAIVGSDSAR
jgi:hypothetical protein